MDYVDVLAGTVVLDSVDVVGTVVAGGVVATGSGGGSVVVVVVVVVVGGIQSGSG